MNLSKTFNKVFFVILCCLFDKNIKAQNLIPFKNDSLKMGFKNNVGKVVLKAQFDAVLPFSENTAAVELNSKWVFIDLRGSYLVKPQYDIVESFTNGVALVNMGGVVDGKWSYINKLGKLIAPITYKYAYSFSNNLGLVQDVNYLYGYIDSSGKIIIAPQYLEASPFNEELAVVFKGKEEYSTGIIKRKIRTGKFGYINTKGEVIVPFEYTKAKSFNNGKAEVEKDGKTFFVYKDEVNKKTITTIQQEDKYRNILFEFSNEKFKPPYGIKNYYEKIIIPAQYKMVVVGKDGYALALKDNKWNIFNKDGKLLSTFEAETVFKFSENLAAIKKRGQPFSFIDTLGNIILPNVGDYVSSFNNGVATVREKSKTKLIDKQGNNLICCYESLGNYNNGLIDVSLETADRYGRFNYVNLKGKLLTKSNFTYAYPFYNGYAIAMREDNSKNKKYYIVDSIGHEKLIGSFNEITYTLNSKIFPVCNWINDSRKWGYINYKGIQTIGFKFDEADVFYNGYAKVLFKNKYGIINENGEFVFEAKYDEITNEINRIEFKIKRSNNPSSSPNYDSFFVFKYATKYFGIDSSKYFFKNQKNASNSFSSAINNISAIKYTIPSNSSSNSSSQYQSQKILSNSFTKYYAYKKESGYSTLTANSKFKVDVTRDYIRMYIEGSRGMYVFWQEFKVVESNNTVNPTGLLYKTSNDNILVFYRESGKDVLSTVKKGASDVTLNISE